MNLTDLAASHEPTSILIESAGRPALTRAELLRLLAVTGPVLHGLTDADHPTIAIVLPHGPELATCVLSCMASCQAAPLNPRYSESEFRFYLDDLGAAALITIPGCSPAAERAAASLGIALVELRPDRSGPSGTFDLHPALGRSSRREGGAADALVLHTSGTTARPKQVGLTQHNLVSSARSIAATLGLTPDDRTVGVMPMFHIHGLVGTLLATLGSGGSLVIDGPFDALRFEKHLAAARATWISAVPTMYQAMMLRPAPDARLALRLARSSSAPLPASVWRALEERFGCPALNSYGMTEASHQVTTNLPPPGERRIGTVGWASTTQVAILDGTEILTAGATGEVLIKGASVFDGYLSPAGVDADAFVDGWFRTGDIAHLGNDGNLALLGRSKEMINVGGEKVSPFEVDDVLLSHPGVAQAVAFGAPCALLGETVHAVVTLAPEHAGVDEATLKRYVRDRLAKFKTPDRIVVVDAIPLGPTGKVQRTRLADWLATRER